MKVGEVVKVGDTDWNLEPLGAHTWRGTVEPARLPEFARAVRAEGGQLIALWGSDERAAGAGFAIHAAFLTAHGMAWISAALAVEAPSAVPSYPDLAAIYPQADRMQRATYDLLGIRAEGAHDSRKWLRHGAWGEDEFPLRHDFAAAPRAELDGYPFVRVDGDGVHEIPVGPIHAGTIEPGHFRFSIIGDRVLKLEQRLGYTHQGVEKRFVGMDFATATKLAGRVSGDSHIAYAWACCMALETASACQVPVRAAWLRALFLEIERVANHLGDLGYLGNDAALAFGFMQFWRLKEDWLRLTARLFGHRYLFDRIFPGGVAVDLTEAAELIASCERLDAEIRELKAIYDEHPGVQDRFAGTGTVKPEVAARLGLTGLAGRASGQSWDARVEFPVAPYDQIEVAMATSRRGDVQARAEVRFSELFESLRLIRVLAGDMPVGALVTPLTPPSEPREGLGWVEGWRGVVLIAARIGADGRIERLHPHDPSWQNWPLLEVGILGNIVPDFPLINKSFNLSYSGLDL
jgi:Ni,Fe-hydrogenase III large subunit/Ni,Fe-hydrogenase III component G